MTPAPTSSGLEAARAWAARANADPDRAAQPWLQCAAAAYRALDVQDDVVAEAAAALLTQSTFQILSQLLEQHPDGWEPGTISVGKATLRVAFHPLTRGLHAPLRIRLARDVSMSAFGGERHGHPGFGAPVAALSMRQCPDPELARLQPHSGSFRNLTAWIEPDLDHVDAPLRLLFADPLSSGAVSVGAHRFTLAVDSSAAYAWAMQVSRLERQGLWSLLGGSQIQDRAGVFLLDDYDPGKRPLVMIHGLGSIPLIWSHLTNAVWGADDLRARYQVWQVVYQTDAPLLLARARVHDYLDQAWRVLDPGGNAPARAGTVLVGHSMGGVIARLLCVDSGDALWNAAFLIPPDALDISRADLQVIQRIFSFTALPGITRAVFLAAPHGGVSSAAVLAHLSRALVGRRSAEVRTLRRVAQANPHAVRPEMRSILLRGWINSVTTLQAGQPVRQAAERLLPPPGIPYHTIAGALPWRRARTDGIVPLDSALIPGAASSLVVEAGHRLHDDPHVLAEIMRILRQ